MKKTGTPGVGLAALAVLAPFTLLFSSLLVPGQAFG